MMNDCCAHETISAPYPHSHVCPANGRSYPRVKRKTVLHHVAYPWISSLTEQGYYFCSDPNCNVVYFGQDNTLIHTDDVRHTVWQKSGSEDDLLCYCFGITKKMALADKTTKTFVIEQTKNALCACETSNPSGCCCLKDFPAE